MKKNKVISLPILVLVFVLVGVCFFTFYPTQTLVVSQKQLTQSNELKPISNDVTSTSIDKSIRSFAAFAKGKQLEGLKSSEEIIQAMKAERTDLVNEFNDFNVHIRFLPDDVEVLLCDKNHFLRYRDFHRTTTKVDFKYLSENIPCECKNME